MMKKSLVLAVLGLMSSNVLYAQVQELDKLDFTTIVKAKNCVIGFDCNEELGCDKLRKIIEAKNYTLVDNTVQGYACYDQFKIDGTCDHEISFLLDENSPFGDSGPSTLSIGINNHADKNGLKFVTTKPSWIGWVNRNWVEDQINALPHCGQRSNK